MPLSYVRIQGYRKLFNIQVEMRNLMVLIGPNGCGKTSFLNVLKLLGNGANEHLLDAIRGEGGMDSILTRERAEELWLESGFNSSRRLDEKDLRYEVVLIKQKLGYVVASESLTQQRETTSSKPFIYFEKNEWKTQYYDGEIRKLIDMAHIDTQELALAQVPRTFENVEYFRKSLKEMPIYSSLDISRKSPIRQSQTLGTALLPLPDGDGLISTLYNMRTNHIDTFDQLMLFRVLSVLNFLL
jgi:predicted ATPase